MKYIQGCFYFFEYISSLFAFGMKIMKKQINYILFAVCISLASCASVNEFSINIQKPAKITFPTDISTIVVANNSIDQPKDINHKAYRFTQELGRLEISADGLGDLLIETLADNLVESNAFDGVFLSSDLSKSGLSFLGTRHLDASEADSVLKKYDGQLLLTLDRYTAMLSSDVEHIGDGVVRNFYTVDVYADLSMYDELGVRKGAPILYRDTLYWSEYMHGNYYFGDPLPSPEEALQSTMYYVADEVAKSLSPQWIETQRWIYSNASTEMRRASTNIGAEKWEAARNIWSKLYQKESKPKQKSRLASNIALTYELGDDLETALKWAEEAEDLLLLLGQDDEDKQRASYYVEELKARILDFKLLDLQSR